ncbi:glycosyltransferase family 2 protein [Antarcticirhabdus aurantiaca]|uniref:Glycosyltransferase family 2 protein n=1 Tax=Antarcticirhabdus aurantiaca TaxID=2606717 RepID=A0ACD4NPS6_9HYPH|nr:glycosyltransferase family 2 protein [Antarcticirhabdus aurantiaca]WAJ28822.1 glycosyltransferase family 2 protein [Jeongeuplla avenae]
MLTGIGMDATPQAITLALTSPGLDPHAVRAVVCVPTFRRPDHLLKTLRSLAEQTGAPPFAVVLVENDDERREGLEAARPLFESGMLAGHAIVAHERGNCSAYNAGWKTALSRFPAMAFLLVVDDDEVAPPDWIARLAATAEATGADIVGGPQRAVFEPGARAGAARRHPVFTPHFSATGPVPILYSSGNVLLRRRVLEAMGAPFLDTRFNFIGGGDSDFYARCRDKGFRFAWCAEAAVQETTPARRTEFSWLNARSLRNGAISSMIEHRRDASPAGRLRTLAKSAALLLAAPIRGTLLGWRTRSALIGLYPLQVAVGRFLAEFGRINEQYRRPEQN